MNYEVQTYKNGKWVISSVQDDKDEGVYEAQRLIQNKRTSAVRVVQEVFDESNNTYRMKVVFRSSKVDGNNAAAQPKQQPKKAKPSTRPKPSAEEFQRKKTDHRPVGKEKPGSELKMFWYVILVGVGLILLLSFIADSL